MTNKFAKEYSHYYKKIPNGVTHLDVYRVLELFDVANPSIAHAIKKLLVAGNRGYKDSEKDVREAIVSLERWLEMREEENIVSNNDSSDAKLFLNEVLSDINQFLNEVR